MRPQPTLALDRVTVRRGATNVIDQLSWEVKNDERWVVLGPNGSGKTTLVQLCTGVIHPTSGTADVLGHRLGRVDVRWLRTRIGLVSGSVTRLFRADLAASDVVLTGRYAALETWWHEYSDDDRARAHSLLSAAGMGEAVDRPFGVLSEGERQQVLLARAMMGEPELVVFDEPAAGLDLGARERLLARLEDLANDLSSPPVIFVTHHVEEIPPSFTHVLLLRRGAAVGAGPLADVLDQGRLGATFDVKVALHRVAGRYSAHAKP